MGTVDRLDVRMFRQCLAENTTPETDSDAIDAVALDIADISCRMQHEAVLLTFNGHQLLDALNAIAPQRTGKQMDTRVTIAHRPLCTPRADESVSELHCWLTDYPNAGAIQLHDQQQPGNELDVVDIANKLITVARWVLQRPDIQRQPDARSLARAVLDLTRPIIDVHIDSRTHTDSPTTKAS